MMKYYHQFSLTSRYKLLIILLALLGAVFILLSTAPYGAGLSSDSVDYISAARSIMRGAGVCYYDGTPLVWFPPLYPALLALIGKIIGSDPISFAHFVNAFLFALTIYLGGLLILKYQLSSVLLIIIGTLAIVFSKSLFIISVMVWSEALFICVALLSINFAYSYITKNDMTSLILFSLSVAILPLIRYVGVILILWGLVVIFFYNRSAGFKNKIVHLALFTIISVLPIGLWLIRNYLSSGTLFGPRMSSLGSNYSLSHNIVHALYVIVIWYAPILLFCCAGACFVYAHIGKEIWRFIQAEFHHTGPVILFVIIFTAFIVLSGTPLHLGQIDNRLLSPVYVPLTLLLLILTQFIVKYSQKFVSGKLIYLILVIGIFIWLLYPPYTVLGDVVDQFHNGDGYSGRIWKSSPTVQYLCNHHISESENTYYSNGAETTYILANFISKLSPDKLISVKQLQGSWPTENKAYFIQLNNINRTGLYTINELMEIANFNLIVRFDDGAIYRITKK